MAARGASLTNLLEWIDFRIATVRRRSRSLQRVDDRFTFSRAGTWLLSIATVINLIAFL